MATTSDRIATQEYRALAIASPLGEDVLLFRRMSAQERLGRLFEYRLEALSENPTLDYAEILGQPVSVRYAPIHGGGIRYFNGLVSDFAQAPERGRYACYHLTLVPWLWFLTRTHDCRIFQNQTVPAIVKTVFRDNGFTDFEELLSGHYPAREYCVQYRESDFNFVSRLLEDEGIYYYFKHQADKHILVLADAYSAHDPVPGYEEIPYFPPDIHAHRARDHIFDWRISQRVQPGRHALTDFDFKIPKKNLRTATAAELRHAQSSHEVFDYPGRYVDFAQGDTYSRLRNQEARAQHETHEGAGDARGLTVGALFKLVNFPLPAHNREYLVVSADYELRSDAYESVPQDERSPPYRCGFSVIDAQLPYRTPRSTFKPTVQGPQTATVVGPVGEEIYTDEFGRVKCQFHWDRYGQSDENSSCWIRVSHPWAGKNWGAVSIPRIGQEVIVDFLEGDPDQPIITGRVYNGDQMPPYKLPAGKVMSGIKSNSTKGGGGYNEIVMDDTKGNELLRIHAQYDMDTTVEHDDRQTVHNDRTITVDGAHTETIKKDTTISITEGEFSHNVLAKNANYFVEGNHVENINGSMSSAVTQFILLQSVEGEVYVIADKMIKLGVGESTLTMMKDGTITLSGKDIKIIGSATVASSAPAVEATGTKEVKMGVGSQTVACNVAKVEIGGAGITSAAIGVHELTGALIKIN